jgi:hypothetical protein
LFDGKNTKWFGLIAFSDNQTLNNNMASSLTAARYFNYFINDMPMYFYLRVVVSALMPHAIEKVIFKPTPDSVAIRVTNDSNDKEAEKGTVNIYTRAIPRKMSDKNTLYLLDGTMVTSTIFEAIHPVYIKSLRRITNKDELKSYRRGGLKEVVEIETFTLFEIQGMGFALGGGKSILLVDGIKLDLDMEKKLNASFFKTRKYLSDDDFDDGSIAVLKQKYPDKKGFDIITLINNKQRKQWEK